MINHSYELDSRSVPVIRDTEIDSDAERYVQDFDERILTDPHPLDIEAFAEDYLGLKIHYDYLSHIGCIFGTMVFYNSLIPVYDPITKRAEFKAIDADTIVIDNSIADGNNEEVLRSSIGHECGHSIYHKTYFINRRQYPEQYTSTNDYGYGFAACSSTNILGIRKGRRKFTSAHAFLEHHAKYFSAAILMPVKAMKLVCRDNYLQFLANIESPEIANQIMINRVAGTFNVSPASADIRIRQLRLGINST